MNIEEIFSIMSSPTPKPTDKKPRWVRIPDGTRVRYRANGREGYVDGLTELVAGPQRNPDGRTQYRVNVGDPDRSLAVEDELLIVTDSSGVVLMLKQKIDYRTAVSEQLKGVFTGDRFVASAKA